MSLNSKNLHFLRMRERSSLESTRVQGKLRETVIQFLKSLTGAIDWLVFVEIVKFARIGQPWSRHLAFFNTFLTGPNYLRQPVTSVLHPNQLRIQGIHVSQDQLVFFLILPN